MLFACLIPVDDLIAEEPTAAPTSISQDAEKAEADEATETIRWNALAPENGKPFNDSCAKLTQKQLSDLSDVVRVQRLIAEEKIITKPSPGSGSHRTHGRTKRSASPPT